MIEDEWRFWSYGGWVTPGGPSRWRILDWDQRRTISVTMDAEQEDADEAIQHLKRHINTLEPDACAIHVGKAGQLISASTDVRYVDDSCVYHPPLSALDPPADTPTAYRSQLSEKDRLAPNVDLVSYSRSASRQQAPALVVFKYYFMVQFVFMRWDEMNLWMRLPRDHPNIVPFDCLVLSEQDATVVGFTSRYIPGGTVEENISRLFRLDWLKQLIRVVDDLNLVYGIMHQDIAPRNLLINPDTQDLMVFDFNYSARIGTPAQLQARNDVDSVFFTLYEIITRDDSFRRVPHEEQNVNAIRELTDWPLHSGVALDAPVSEFRAELDHWLERRNLGPRVTVYTQAEQHIDWPKIPEPFPPSDLDANGNPIPRFRPVYSSAREKEISLGHKILEWRRPPQSEVNGYMVLSNGSLARESGVDG